MSQKERSLRYGALRGETIAYEQDEKPPSYGQATDGRAWPSVRCVAVVGFVLIQVVLVLSILNQLYTDNFSSARFEPEQIHLSLGENEGEYYVSWATKGPSSCQLIWFKHGSQLKTTVEATMHPTLLEVGEENTAIAYKRASKLDEQSSVRKYFYDAKMSTKLNQIYYYYVACHEPSKVDEPKKVVRESERFQIRTVEYEKPDRSLSLVFFGDLGLKNGQSVPRLTEEALSYRHDLMIHNGDFAYDLHDERGARGDEFMRVMEPIAARLPYQTSVGNHEIAHNFSYYDSRFKMINRGPIERGRANNFFYSFNAGPVHFVAISTEFYYFLDYVGISPLVSQYEWLVADLRAASSEQARSKRPWIVVFGHRPMYCSSRDEDDCSKDSNLLRKGLPFTGAYALEELFYEFGVDVELYSHEHQYERFLPIYNGSVKAGTDKPQDPYFNPLAPVHLISGSAGCQEKLDPFDGQSKPGSIKRIADYGYTTIKATRCQLLFEQISDDKAGTVVDSFTISKNKQNFPPSNSKKLIFDGC